MNHLEQAVYNSDIGDTSLEHQLANLGIELPTTGLILDIGSGPSALLERQGMYKNPDLTIIPLDPHLYSPSYRQDYMWDDYGLYEVVSRDMVHAVGGIVQELPFKDDSFDMVVSHAAVPTYLPLSPEAASFNSFTLAFSEIHRVLKPGAKAVLGPMLEPTFKRSQEVLDALDIKFTGEDIPLPDYYPFSDPWFSISFEKQ